MLQNIFVQLGFTEKEHLLYQTLLDHGPLEAPTLAKLTGITRTYIYRLSQNLSKLGLLTIKSHPCLSYSATPPDNLRYLITKKQHHLNQVLKDFEQVYNQLNKNYNLIYKRPLIQYLATLKLSKKDPITIEKDLIDLLS